MWPGFGAGFRPAVLRRAAASPELVPEIGTVLRLAAASTELVPIFGLSSGEASLDGVGASLPIVPSGTHGFAGGTVSSTAGAAVLTYIQRIKIAIIKRQELRRTVASSEFLPLTIFGDHRSQLVRKRLMRLDAYEIGYSYKTYFLQTRFIAIE